MLDVVFREASVVDGTGAPAFRADVGLRDDTIVYMGGTAGEASHEVDARRLVLCPGFIDMHSHADLFYAFPQNSQPKLLQGVTTEVIGNCGLGVYPVKERDREFLRRHLAGVMGSYPGEWPWEDFRGYCAHVETSGLPVNVIPLAAHSSLRMYVMGLGRGAASPEELDSMEEILEEMLEQGAWGLSTGLIYPPACYSSQEELVRLCAVASRRGGYFAIHMRSEGDGLLESLDEAIDIATQAQVSLEISHLKAYGKENWHKVEPMLERIHRAHDDGLHIHFDQYPYTCGSTTLTALLPPWVFQGGLDAERLRDPAVAARIYSDLKTGIPGWESYVRQSGWEGIVFSSGVTEENEPLEGKSLQEIADIWRISPAGALLRLLAEEGSSASMLIAGMDEGCVQTIMQDNLHLLGSDGLYGRKPHPRVYGSCPRLLRTYVFDEKLLTLEEGVRRMTGAPAARLGLADRGVLKVGNKADLVLFDPESIRDESSYDDPANYPFGIVAVVVNGKVAARREKLFDVAAGRVLRKG